MRPFAASEAIAGLPPSPTCASPIAEPLGRKLLFSKFPRSAKFLVRLILGLFAWCMKTEGRRIAPRWIYGMFASMSSVSQSSSDISPRHGQTGATTAQQKGQ